MCFLSPQKSKNLFWRLLLPGNVRSKQCCIISIHTLYINTLSNVTLRFRSTLKKCAYSHSFPLTWWPYLFFTCSPLLLSSHSAVETTSIQEADQSCAIMLKSISLSCSLGHGEEDHLISSSSLSVHLLLAQPGDELGRLFVCCPPDVACP